MAKIDIIYKEHTDLKNTMSDLQDLDRTLSKMEGRFEL